MANEYYSLTVAGLQRQLPICPLNDKLSIAGFIMFSDVELTIACAKELLKKCPEADYIVTAESKGIPLSYEMSRQSGIPYLLARKSVKLYMRAPIHETVTSNTTVNEQTLYLDGQDAEKMKGKRVLIVDDVISTGESLRTLEHLVNSAEGKIVGRATVLAEGDSADRDDIIFLEKLPLFTSDGNPIE